MMKNRPMHPIPVTAAKAIAEDYGYDQVVVIARRVGEEPGPRGEHVTTYGVDKTHCGVAARMGAALKRFMGWPEELIAEQMRDIPDTNLFGALPNLDFAPVLDDAADRIVKQAAHDDVTLQEADARIYAGHTLDALDAEQLRIGILVLKDGEELVGFAETEKRRRLT